MEADSSSESPKTRRGLPEEKSSSVSSSAPSIVDTSERAVQIVNVDPETREFVLDVDALSKILLREECREKPVCVISIAGDFRKGKSFLLNFLLRYLASDGANDWCVEKDVPLKGNCGVIVLIDDLQLETFIFKDSPGEVVLSVIPLASSCGLSLSSFDFH